MRDLETLDLLRELRDSEEENHENQSCVSQDVDGASRIRGSASSSSSRKIGEREFDENDYYVISDVLDDNEEKIFSFICFSSFFSVHLSHPLEIFVVRTLMKNKSCTVFFFVEKTIGLEIRLRCLEKWPKPSKMLNVLSR